MNMANVMRDFQVPGSNNSSQPSYPTPGIPRQTPSMTNPRTSTFPSNTAPNNSTSASIPPNPFALNPALMQQVLSRGLGGAGSMPSLADSRPPEERYQVQLQVFLRFH